MFLSDHWIEVSDRIDRFVRVQGIENFLKCRDIRGNMVQVLDKIYEKDMEYLKQYLSDELIERFIKGYLPDERYNPIHHLYILMNYINKKKFENIESIVEWGGGYGSLARIIQKFKPQVKYTIIDLPIMSKIQSWYLKNETNIKFIDIDRLQKSHRMPKCDLFISTWALTECTKEAWEFVMRKQFFGARKFLFGYFASQ